MSDIATSEDCPANAVRAARAERLRPGIVAGLIVLLLAVVVVMLRLYRLDEIPPGLHHDEGSNGLNALLVLQGEHAVFFLERDGREGLIAYAIALTTSLLGRTMLAMRIPTALASAGTVFIVFWLGYLLFGRDESGRVAPWRGLLFGGVGAGLLAVSLGQTIIGRTAFRANFLPLLLSLCFALLWCGWRQRSWWRVAMAGACAGLLPYTYIAARFTPFLFLLFGLSFLLPWARNEDGGEKYEKISFFPHFSSSFSRLRSELQWAGIFVGVAALVAAPILVHFVLHPDHFFLRSRRLWIFDSANSQGDPLGAFLSNAWEHLLVFGLHGDRTWLHNFAGQPMLNPWEALFFWFGMGMAVWRWQQRPAYRLLLLWLGVMLLPAFLARQNSPNTLRMMGAAPAIYLLISVGLWEAFVLLRNRLFGHDNAKLLMPFGVLIASLILVQGETTFRTYFQKWAASPETFSIYYGELAEAARILNAHPLDSDTVYLIPFTYFLTSFRYLYQDTAPAHFIYTNEQDLPQKIESTLAAVENAATVKVFDWNVDSSKVGEEEELSTILLGKYGRYLESVEYRGFQLHTFADIDLERPWRFMEQSEQLPITYDGGIALQLLALGQGPKQLSTEQPLEARLDRPMWVALKWHTIPGLEIDYKASVRLHDAEGNRVYQDDSFLLQSYSARTSQWTPGEEVDTLHIIDFPAEFLPGEYEIRLVVYDSETLKPTAQMDVWEPEITLARLRLMDVR